ncbi:MAG: hypothetical protein K6E17_07500 [Clostridiales bacterium]|nr:hypothetical protein [Clostridiales bacterium]
MTNELNRELIVTADGNPVESFNRACLRGSDMLGLYPMPFTLKIWNISESDYYLLSAAKEITVSSEGSILASGTVSDVYWGMTPEGKVTEVIFSPVIRLWEAPVSLSVEAGVKVSETVRKILEASGTGISMLTFPGNDPVRSRGQAFFGRAAECVADALSAASARSCLTAAGLCVIPSSGLPVSMELTEEDLIDEPIRAGDMLMTLKTKPTGWPLGKMVSVTWKGVTTTGLVIERSIDADNAEGNWQAELILEVKI